MLLGDGGDFQGDPGRSGRDARLCRRRSRYFYPAEEEHENFVERNPGDPYIVQNDLPKLRNLERQFPNLIRH
jgi:hypothetical protein